MSKPKEKSVLGSVLSIIGKALVLALETVLIAAAVLVTVLYMIYNGPSVSFKNLLVRTLNETSAAYIVNEIFMSPEEIDAIINSNLSDEYVETDTSLVTIAVSNPDSTESEDTSDAWGFVDEDGDGIVLEELKGPGYTGFMMIVKDPSRVILGSDPNAYGGRGFTVAEMGEKFDAVAAINAGGFYDPNGTGNGSIPDSVVVYEGNIYYAGYGTRGGFVGLDSNHILHVAASISSDEIKAADIQYGVCFGPVLIANGEPVPGDLKSGVNPRTAIGQRSDGAILLLVIDGRSALSIGATHQDVQDIMLRYGAVNAMNLDGGSSSMMWYNGEYVNNCASVIGIRPVPTAFVVLKEGVNTVG